jgi:hypothetical protein
MGSVAPSRNERRETYVVESHSQGAADRASRRSGYLSHYATLNKEALMYTFNQEFIVENQKFSDPEIKYECNPDEEDRRKDYLENYAADELDW